MAAKVEVVFTFATNSEQWGGSLSYQNGKYPVKLYNSQHVLIFQVENGGDNSGKLPIGGVVVQTTDASSMSAVIANPITLYGEWNTPVITQSGQSGDLYNYYLTSYSRGSDGVRLSLGNNTLWHNLYLDSYIPLRPKSIYDPCPYGYRIPSNGTYNEFTYTGWIMYSYVGGVIFNNTWLVASGRPDIYFAETGNELFYLSSTTLSAVSPYILLVSSGKIFSTNAPSPKHIRHSVRCIEDCDLLPL